MGNGTASVADSLYDESYFSFMGLPRSMGLALASPDRRAHKVLMLAWHIIVHRGWSLSRHDVPPECFATVAFENQVDAHRAMAAMKLTWKNLMMLEQRLHDVRAARQL